jgi:putative oxidoreductase
MTPSQPSMMTSIGLLILRLGMSGYMMTHGWGKLQMLLGGEFEQFGDPIGVGKTLSLILAVFGEFVCPALVALGLFTHLASIPVVITMAVAAFIVHAADPWTMGAGASKEPALLFLIPFLALVFTGAGRLSIDAVLCARCGKRKAKPADA